MCVHLYPACCAPLCFNYLTMSLLSSCLDCCHCACSSSSSSYASDDAAAGALVHLLRSAPPLRCSLPRGAVQQEQQQLQHGATTRVEQLGVEAAMGVAVARGRERIDGEWEGRGGDDALNEPRSAESLLDELFVFSEVRESLLRMRGRASSTSSGRG